MDSNCEKVAVRRPQATSSWRAHSQQQTDNAGKQVVARLLAGRTPVTVLDKVFYDDEVSALRSAYPFGSGSGLRVIHGDIRDPLKLKEAMTLDVVGVIHLAAVSRVLWCLENEPDCTDVNVRGAQSVIEALPSGWFIQASSREVSETSVWSGVECARTLPAMIPDMPINGVPRAQGRS
jgi:nucleoside-diphosphate-sugar epimerase